MSHIVDTAVHSAPQHLLGTFPTYAGAEQLVDTLSDKGFPVEHTRIVGNGLRSVEIVTGRMTPARAAGAGAASGAWMGLFVGLLLGLFSSNETWLSTVLVATAMGTAWFAVYGFLAQRATHGRRDFASSKSLEAQEYAVYVESAYAERAVKTAGLF
jgi:hypothetical protein